MTAPGQPSSGGSAVPARGQFHATRWSLVVRAGGESTGAHDALARLCATYWYPLYAHARRRGLAPPDAEDATQAFFARLLQRRLVARADAARGRFRSFLLASLDHFLADERAKARARKRGGGSEPVSLDVVSAERRFLLEPVGASAPDNAFDRSWALTVLETVLQQLALEYTREGRLAVFEALRPALLGARAAPYAVLGRRLGLSESAVKVAVHRLRQRYRGLLEAEIAETVATPEEASAELRHLFAAVATEGA